MKENPTTPERKIDFDSRLKRMRGVNEIWINSECTRTEAEHAYDQGLRHPYYEQPISP